MRVLYLDCTAGASGDMFLGALVDLGVPLATLKRELEKLSIRGFRLTRSKGTRGGLSGTAVRVIAPKDPGHRHWSDFEKVLVRSRLAPAEKARALGFLRRIFEVEAEVHGTTAEKVHLHELGSLDTLVDVVGTVVGVASLRISEIVCSPVNMGSGFVATEHGRLSVPAPATALLLKGAPVFSEPMFPEEDELERTTPTGALLASSLADRFGPFPSMTVRKVGYGLGTKDPREGRPNALRLVLGERSGGGSDRAVVVEATIDDMTPEQMGFLQGRLLEAGVLDVFLTPVLMKKNRPGVNVTVLTEEGAREQVSRILFSEGTTLGVRYHEVQREVLERRWVTASTRYGNVRVKEGLLHGRVVSREPEFEDCRKVALAEKVPLKAVQRAALGAAKKKKKKKKKKKRTRA